MKYIPNIEKYISAIKKVMVKLGPKPKVQMNNLNSFSTIIFYK